MESLTEKIETGSSKGKLVFHVFGALAEFECNLVPERTLGALKAARSRGRKGGRPRKLSGKELNTIRALLKTTEVPVQEKAKRYGVSRSTLYRNGNLHESLYNPDEHIEIKRRHGTDHVSLAPATCEVAGVTCIYRESKRYQR